MNYLLEQPLAVVLLGVVLSLGVGLVWTSTGRKEWLFALGAIVVLTIAGLIIEHLVLTDREAIEATLTEIARDVESNNITAIIGHIATGATKPLQDAQSELPNYHFDDCRVTKIHNIDIDTSLEPRSAIVEFNVVALGTFSAGGIELSDQQVFRWVRLQMVREKDGRWKVQDYRHEEPQHFMFDRSTDDAGP